MTSTADGGVIQRNMIALGGTGGIPNSLMLTGYGT
jgi:hypothetical protein